MQQKLSALLVLILLFAIGFWGLSRVVGSAKNYESGSQENPLASKSYLENVVKDNLRKMEIEIKYLSDRVNALQKVVGK